MSSLNSSNSSEGLQNWGLSEQIPRCLDTALFFAFCKTVPTQTLSQAHGPCPPGARGHLQASAGASFAGLLLGDLS